MTSLISTRLSVIFCKWCVPPQACRLERREARVRGRGGAVAPRAPLMAFTCFNQHQSIVPFFIFIEIESAAAGGRPFTHQRTLTGSNITAGPLTGSRAPQSPSHLAHAISSKLGPTLWGAGIYRKIMAFSFPSSLITGVLWRAAPHL